jgi:hypothetical protein
MSAYSVPDNQIHVMVSYILKSLPYNGDTFYIPPHDSIVVGRMFEPNVLNLQSIWDCLRNANNDSLFARYEDRHGDMGDKPVPFICAEVTPEPLHMIKMVNNFMYQACETSDWYTSKAYSICQGIIGLAINRLMPTDRTGHDSIPWGFDGDITPDPTYCAPKLSEVDKPEPGKLYRIC